MALAIWLMMLALPSFRPLLQHWQLETGVRQLYQVLNFSRSLAITTGQPVTVRPGQEGEATSATWMAGSSVYLGGKLARYFRGPSGDISVRYRGSFGRPEVIFKADGSASAGAFSVCLPHVVHCQKIIIARSGRVRLG